MRSTGAIILLVVALLVGFAGCSGCSAYNNLVAEDETVEQSWNDVETYYQRRANLIPNLISTVQGQADFEQETLQNVIEARSQATSLELSADDLNDPVALQRFQQAQSQLGSALSRLLAVSERYPELRANEGFLRLQDQLEGAENRIATAVRDYNAAVASYNSEVRSFPTNIVAGVTGFERREGFEADPDAEEVPEVDFDR